MMGWKTGWRWLSMVAAGVLLAGCQVIPKAPDVTTDPVVVDPDDTPLDTALPADDQRHRIALLVPLTGENGRVGQSIANATTMALLDTNAANLRITTYDTASDARAAARQAVADGNKLILGPLLSESVPSVLAEARPARVPVISYSNDESVAAPDLLVMGHLPGQSIERSIGYAKSRGAANVAAIVPDGEYGRRAELALTTALRENGLALIGIERFDRGNTSIVSASERLRQRGGFDTVLIADGSRLFIQSANVLRPSGRGTTQLIGTELLSGEASIIQASSARGTWFSAVPDARFKRFAESYNTRFGSQPFRIATLGYDSVLLVLRIARDWKVGSSFPTGKLYAEDGFLGLDGAFRFQPDGVVERTMEVREVRAGEVVVVDQAPAKFVE